MFRYVLLIEKEQEIDLNSLEKILKKTSKKWREHLYKLGEFEEGTAFYGYYLFVEGLLDELREIKYELQKQNVFCELWKKREWKKYLKYTHLELSETLTKLIKEKEKNEE